MGLGKSTSPSNPGNTNYATSTSTQAPPSYLNSAYQNLVSNSQNLVTNGGGFTPNQTQAFSTIGGIADPNNANYAQARNTLTQSLVPTSANVSQYLSPYNDAVVQATMRNMQEQNAQQQQGVIGDAIAKGAMGGNRVGVAQGELARQQDLANQQTIAGLYNQNYSQALGAAQNDKSAAMQAAGQMQGLNESQLAAANSQLQAGTQQQTYPYAQQGWLNNILSTTGGVGGGTTSSTAPDGNALSSIMGGLTSMLGFLSDERAKTDIQHIGKTFDGQPIYSYRMKGDPRTSIGLLAQNVQHQHPDAIGRRGDGLMTVDYGRATQGAANRGHFAEGGLVPTGYGGMYDPLNYPFNAGASGAMGNYPDAPEIKPEDDPDMPTAAQFAGAQRAGIGFGTMLSGKKGYYPGLTGPSLASGGKVGSSSQVAKHAWSPWDRADTAPPQLRLTPWKDDPHNPNYVPPDPDYMGLGVVPPEAGEAAQPVSAAVPDSPQGLMPPYVLDSPSPTLADVGYDDGSGAGAGGAGLVSPDAVSYYDPTQVQEMDPNASLVPNASLPPGQMPPGTGVGPQFVTEPDPRYSQNLGEAWNSLIHGDGLNMSPDMSQSLMAAGFGMMAGTHPFAAQNIGEGGLAGIKTWNERQALERENAKARSGIAYEQGTLGQAGQRLWLDAQKTAADIGLTSAQTQTIKYPAMAGMTGNVVRDINNPYAPGKIVPYTSDDAGGGAGAAGNGSGIPTGPAEIETPTPTIDDAGNVSFHPQPPAHIPVNNMGFNQVGQGIISAQSTQAITDARKNYTLAKDMGVQLKLMKEAASKLPADGILAQGPGLTQRAEIVRNLNTISAMLGMTNPDGTPYQINPEAVANVEELNKFTTRLGFDLSRTTGSDVASSVVQQAISAVPGTENSPQGFKLVVASIQAGLNRQSDYYEFLQKWTSKNGGDITGADEYFNEHYPPQDYAQYALAASVAIVPKSQSEIDNAPPGTVFNIGGKILVPK